MMEVRRWPGWVYGSGQEPDPRWSFANERTFLAWLRTALALISAGVVLDVVDLGLGGGLQHAFAVILVLLGFMASGASWTRWARAERAMRRGEPLPGVGLGLLFAGVMMACAAFLAIRM